MKRNVNELHCLTTCDKFTQESPGWLPREIWLNKISNFQVDKCIRQFSSTLFYVRGMQWADMSTLIMAVTQNVMYEFCVCFNINRPFFSETHLTEYQAV